MKEKSEKSKNTILPANKRKLLNRKIVANKSVKEPQKVTNKSPILNSTHSQIVKSFIVSILANS